MGNSPAGARKAYQTLLRKKGAKAISEARSRAGKIAQSKHPNIANFRDPEFATKAARKRHEK